MTLADGSPATAARICTAAPSVQGERCTLASASGHYLLALLPAGEYTATVSIGPAGASTYRVTLTAGEQLRLDVTLETVRAFDALTVVDAISDVASTQGAVATTFSLSAVNTAPIDRTVRAVSNLAPGVNENGPTSNIGSSNERPALMISGAPSYDSLFLVNGVNVNENLRGQPLDLFIEDAIESIRVETGRISAEYGSFTGGVVNVVTRSGGNRTSGSLRATLSNPIWSANNRHDESLGADGRSDQTNATWEATLGGSLRRDRLWYFAAGRRASFDTPRSTYAPALPGDIEPATVPYEHRTDEDRLELKLTGAVSERHRLIASWLGLWFEEVNSTFNPIILDTRMLVPVDYPSDLLAVRYEGMPADRLFVEAQHSRRRSAVEQKGDLLGGRIEGTWLLDPQRSGARYHSPVFRPATQRYDNESWLAKVSSFRSSGRLGTHDLLIGAERFTSLTRGNYYFSGSDYDVRASRTIVRGTEVFPVLGPGTILEFNPVLDPNEGIRLITESAFLNDRVSLARQWTINLGLRYDRQGGTMGSGQSIARTESWSPRLALAFDPRGDGRLSILGGYARYAAKTPESLAVFTLPGGGQAARFAWAYAGPCINCDVFAPTGQLVPTDEALHQLFDWFDSIGGTASQPTIAAQIPGFSTGFDGDLAPPSVVERSLGLGARLGANGWMRADLVDRRWQDLYGSRIDRSTGQTGPDPYFGRRYDVARLESSPALRREYVALQVHVRIVPTPGWSAGATYTWSRLEGNGTSEIRCCAASPTTLAEYPEYTEARWNHPLGPLSSSGRPGWPAPDERHRARLWLTLERELARGRLSVSLLQSLATGRPFEAVGFIDPRPWVENPGYLTPPSRVAYFFSRPGTYRTDTITATDLAVVWTLPLRRGVEAFLKPEVLNLFDEQGVIHVDTTVVTAVNDRSLRSFDPFRERPVEGVHYRLGPSFGRPIAASGYQTPRTFRLGIGLRF